jgi:hypothetical protein
MRRLLFACIGASLAGVAAFAQSANVSIPAHTGSVDESSIELVNFGSNGAAGLRSTVAAGTEALIRYLIPTTAVPEAAAPCLQIAFRDTGADAQVRVAVRELDFLGANRVLGSFNSDSQDAGASPDFRSQMICFSPRPTGPFFDYSQHAYVIEVTLRRVLTGGQPGMQLMQLHD